MKTIRFVLALFLVLATTVGSLRADPVPYNHDDKSLVYDAARSEDFSTLSAIGDLIKWKVDVVKDVEGVPTPTPTPDGITTILTGNTSIAGDALVLTGHKVTTQVAGSYYTGATLTSLRFYGYGYYEICAKMPAVLGWGASLATAGGASNQVTICTFNSINNTGVTSASRYLSFYKGTNGYPSVGYRYSEFGYHSGLWNAATLDPLIDTDDLKTEFHYYGFEWTPRELVIYFNGVVAQRVLYPGPHSPVKLKLSLTARNAGAGQVPVDGATFQVKHVRYWTRRYDVERRDSAMVPVPTNLASITPPTSELAFNHKVFDWNSGTNAYVMKPGGSGTLASKDSANPVKQYYTQGDLAKWHYPGATPATVDLFAWNPSMYPTSALQNEFGTDPDVTNFARYTIVGNGSAVSGTADIDQIRAGQQWVSLGAHPFSGTAGYVKVSALDWKPEYAIRAAAMQFFELDYFFDGFATSSGWVNKTGNWSVGSDVLTQSSTTATGISRYIYNTEAPDADYFVRARVKFGATNPAANVGIIGRHVDGINNADTYYLLKLNAPASDGPYTANLLRYNAGTATTLASAEIRGIDPVDDYVEMHLFMVGARLQGLVAGQCLFDLIDAAPLTANGKAGVRTYGGTAIFDNAGGGR